MWWEQRAIIIHTLLTPVILPCIGEVIWLCQITWKLLGSFLVLSVSVNTTDLNIDTFGVPRNVRYVQEILYMMLQKECTSHHISMIKVDANGTFSGVYNYAYLEMFSKLYCVYICRKQPNIVRRYSYAL